MPSNHLIFGPPLFSFCLQSFPVSGSFPVSQLFESDDQSIGASASASVLLMNIQDWFPLGLTDWISLQFKGLSRVFVSTTIWKHWFFSTQSSLWSSNNQSLDLVAYWLLAFIYLPQDLGHCLGTASPLYTCCLFWEEIPSLAKETLSEEPWIDSDPNPRVWVEPEHPRKCYQVDSDISGTVQLPFPFECALSGYIIPGYLGTNLFPPSWIASPTQWTWVRANSRR